MIPYYGDFPVNATVYIPINTFDSNDPTASVTATNLLNTDVHIHKDGGTTQRNNAAGITMTIDYDSITGNHLLIIDTSDNTVADFFQAGHEYQVRVEGVTVDAGTINAWVGCFSIERSGGALALIKNGTYGLSALNALLTHADYGLAKLVRSTTPANTLTITSNKVDVNDKTGFSLAATGADLILKGSTFIQAIVAAINELATYGLTALNTLLVTTGIKTATNSDKTGYTLSTTPPTAADIKTALEADGSKIDHLWEMTEDDGGVRRFTENALEEAPSSSGLDAVGVRTAIGLSAANLDTQLSTIDANVDAILVNTGTTIPALINAGAGAGTILHTYTITDSGDGSPIDGVEVWVSTDAAGVNVVASGYTNSSGVFSVMLDAGTYYFWRKRSGYNFVNPDQETVSA
jgi:hypothetical protein